MTGAAGQSIALDSASFRAIADLAYRESGLTLVEEKSSMIQSRLRHRLRDLGLPSFKDYCELVISDAGTEERRRLISALTTNVSHFFRESHHYDSLQDIFRKKLPDIREGGQMRIWSAGCSNGQEAFSAAMALFEAESNVDDLDIRILATDIDPQVVAFARVGSYPQRYMAGVPEPLQRKYFSRTNDEMGDVCFQANARLRKMIKFNELNLLMNWPMRKQFDVIFCRNVVIYFDHRTQTDLWPRFQKHLMPDGLLFLGHSERISEPSTFGFECVGPTTYRRRSN